MIAKDDITEIQSYLTDASGYQGNIRKIYLPENTQELKQLIKTLYQSRIPSTASGAGTGLTGGRTANEGVLISLEMLDKILAIDYQKKYIRVQSGVLLAKLQSELKSGNHFLPPNPTENISSIGGNISTNASGSRTFKYGSYRNHVLQLNIILPDGNELILNRNENLSIDKSIIFTSIDGTKYSLEIDDIGMPNVKHNAGYFLKNEMDAIDLFIGSEGTLGIIAEAVLSIKEMPEQILGLNIFFANESKMIEFINTMRRISRINNQIDYREMADTSARLIEMYDNNSLELISKKYPNIPHNAIGCVWVEQEYLKTNEEIILNNWLEIIKSFNDNQDVWVAVNDSEHQRFADFRHTLPLSVNELVIRAGFHKAGTDTAVPEDKFSEFYFFIKQLLVKSGIQFAIWGHAGDSHIHANLLPKSKIEFDKSNDLINLIIDKTIFLGGTVSAEHGIGKLKKKYLSKMLSQDKIDVMKKIKDTLDPDYLLGRGNIFDK
jgi:D-lactate dehydrogenase (cytochrome)